MDHCRMHIDEAELAGRSVESGRIVLAGELSGSKGRFTRTWHAPEGGLWGCMIHANSLLPPSTMLISLAVGVAACEALRQAGASAVTLRWVNDLLFNGGKTGGFLIESHTGKRYGEQYHLIGFGLNINNCDFPAELKNVATSLKSETGRESDLGEIALTFLAKLVWNFGLLYSHEARNPDWFEDAASLHPVISRWCDLSDTVGRRVVFGYDVETAPQYSAEVVGIARDGGLRMILDDGHEIIEHSGEVRYLEERKRPSFSCS